MGICSFTVKIWSLYVYILCICEYIYIHIILYRSCSKKCLKTFKKIHQTLNWKLCHTFVAFRSGHSSLKIRSKWPVPSQIPCRSSATYKSLVLQPRPANLERSSGVVFWMGKKNHPATTASMFNTYPILSYSYIIIYLQYSTDIYSSPWLWMSSLVFQ